MLGGGGEIYAFLFLFLVIFCKNNFGSPNPIFLKGTQQKKHRAKNDLSFFFHLMPPFKIKGKTYL